MSAVRSCHRPPMESTGESGAFLFVIFTGIVKIMKRELLADRNKDYERMIYPVGMRIGCRRWNEGGFSVEIDKNYRFSRRFQIFSWSRYLKGNGRAPDGNVI